MHIIGRVGPTTRMSWQPGRLERVFAECVGCEVPHPHAAMHGAMHGVLHVLGVPDWLRVRPGARAGRAAEVVRHPCWS